jgi:carboxypeptidase D
LTNVLWVEQPVGTGFSIGEVTAKDETDVARDFNNFFLNFQQTFGIKNFKIFLTGESYAGRYVSYISAAMLDRKDPVHFNVSGTLPFIFYGRALTKVTGALLYDPCIGSYVWEQNQVPIVPFAVKNNNVLGLNASFLTQLQALDKKCGYADFRKKYLTFPPPGKQPHGGVTDLSCDIFGMVYAAAYAPNPCFNIYEISSQCPLLSDPLGFPTGLQYSYPGQPIYFNRADVKKAMNAPLDVEWLECKGPVFIGNGGPEGEGDTSPDPIQSVLPRVIEATNRVLISNGDLDMSIITDGTLLAIQNMTWGGKLGFQSLPNTSIVITLPDLQYASTFEANGGAGLEDPQGTMGIQHRERGLMWAQTYLSGHMQPQFQPRSSYRHLQWLLGHIETL